MGWWSCSRARGMLVPELNVETQLTLLEVRRELDKLGARLAAERASPDKRQRFRALAAAMTKVGKAMTALASFASIANSTP